MELDVTNPLHLLLGLAIALGGSFALLAAVGFLWSIVYMSYLLARGLARGRSWAVAWKCDVMDDHFPPPETDKEGRGNCPKCGFGPLHLKDGRWQQWFPPPPPSDGEWQQW